MNAIERKAWWQEAERLLGLWREIRTGVIALHEVLEEDDHAEVEMLLGLIRAKPAIGEDDDAEHTRSGPLAS